MTGCADLIEEESDGALMFDIGGGSSELAWLDFRGGRPRRQGRMAASIRSWQSLPVGVVSIAEKFGGVDVTPETFEAMVAYVAEHLREFRGRGKLQPDDRRASGAPDRHLGHGDDAGGAASRARALRAAEGRRAVDDARPRSTRR